VIERHYEICHRYVASDHHVISEFSNICEEWLEVRKKHHMTLAKNKNCIPNNALLSLSHGTIYTL
jgi:hypothetical protein